MAVAKYDIRYNLQYGWKSRCYGMFIDVFLETVEIFKNPPTSHSDQSMKYLSVHYCMLINLYNQVNIKN